MTFISAAAFLRRGGTPLLMKALLSSLCTPNPFDSIFSSQEASDLLNIAQRAGVSRVGFLRHGKTNPKPLDGLDFDRLLTDQGGEQATTAGSLFGKELGPIYPRVLVSPSPRTVETASFFLNAAIGSDWENQVELIPIPGLYDGTMQPEGSILFQKIGYAPLRDYVDIDAAIVSRGGEEEHSVIERDVQVAQKLLTAYARLTLEAIQSATACNHPSSKNETNAGFHGHILWVVAHAVYLPAAALGLAAVAQCDESSRDVILRTNTLEAEGYLIDLNEAKATYLSRSGGLST